MTAFPFTRSSRVTSTRSAMSSSAFANFVRLGLSLRMELEKSSATTTSDGSRRIRGDRGGDADGHDDDGHRAPDRAQQRAAQAGIGC